MKGGIRPVRRTLNQSVLHRVVMELIAMQVEIPFIPDLVFLIKPLPNGLLPLRPRDGEDVAAPRTVHRHVK